MLQQQVDPHYSLAPSLGFVLAPSSQQEKELYPIWQEISGLDETAKPVDGNLSQTFEVRLLYDGIPNPEANALDACLEIMGVSPSIPAKNTQGLKAPEDTGIPAVVEEIAKENMGDKRQLPPSPTKSPQKLKFLLPELFKPLLPRGSSKETKDANVHQ